VIAALSEQRERERAGVCPVNGSVALSGLGILPELEKAGILTLADKADQVAEATVVITPYKGKNKPG
jgi:hypothetical protein